MAAVNKSILSVGRRKTSVARASMKKGSGMISVNNQDLSEYVGNPILELKIREPLIIADQEKEFDFKVKVFGGGVSSQAESIRQAIARALIEISKGDELKKKFLQYDRSLLVTNTRFKEMKKPNTSKARAKRQKSYR